MIPRTPMQRTSYLPEREIRVTTMVAGQMYGTAYIVSDSTLWSLANHGRIYGKNAGATVLRIFVQDRVEQLTYNLKRYINNELTKEISNSI